MSVDRDNRDTVEAGEEQRAEPRPLAPGKRMLTTSMAAVIARMGNGPTPRVTPELETALGESGNPLPDAGRYSSEVGADVSRARVVTSPAAAAAASSIGAAAFTLGERVFFGAGSYAPGTDAGDHVMRHELTHVAQQAGSPVPPADQLQFTTPGSAAETEAHEVADRGGTRPSAQPARVARFDDWEKRQESQIGGNSYAFFNAKDIFFDFSRRLMLMPLPSPSPYVTWAQGSDRFLAGFASQTLNMANVDYEDWRKVIDRIVQPDNLRALMDRGRVVFGNKTDDKTGDTYNTGPLRYQGTSTLPLVHAVHRKLLDSLKRMVPRFLAAWQAAEEAGATPVASAITASTPCDEALIQTLVEWATLVDVNLAGYKSSGEQAVDPDLVSGVSELDYRFVDHDKAPNWIEVTSPAGATAELVASFALGSPTESHRLVASPPYFGLPMEVAEKLRDSLGLSTGDWGSFGAHMMPWLPGNRELLDNERDPAFGLLRSGAADQAALAEAGAGGETGGGDRGALLQILERTRNGLAACAQFAAPFGLGDDVSEPIAYIDGRLAFLASAPEEEVGRWFVQAEKQDDVVGRAAMGLEQVDRHLRAMGIAEASQMGKMPKAVRIPLERVAGEFVDAAILSRLVVTAEKRVEKAEEDLRLAPLDTMELILKDIQTRVYLLRSIDKKHHPSITEWQFDEEDELWDEHLDMEEKKLEADPNYKYDETWEPPKPAPYRNADTGSEASQLQEELLILRGRMLAGETDVGPDIQELYKKIDRVAAETEIAQGHALLSKANEDVLSSDDSAWAAVANGFTGDLFTASDVWLEGEGYKFHFEYAWSYYQRGKIQEARQYLAENLGNDEGFKSFLQRAYDTIDDIQTRVMILKIATLIGIVLVTMGFGALAEGVALGAGASEVGAFIIGATVEAASFTALDALVFGSDNTAGTFATEFGANLATFGLLRAWRLRKAAKVADDAMAAAKLDNATRLEKMRGYLLKGKELTGEGLIIAATAYAQMQVDALRQKGEFVSLSEIRDMGKQGLAMVLGIAVGGRLFRLELDELRRLGQQFGEDLGKRVDALRDMAKMVETTKQPDLALELVRQDRALLDKELELRQKRDDPDGTSPVKPDDAQAAHRALMAETELTLGLDEVVPGRVYMGTPDQVGPIVKRLEAEGKTVKPVDDNGRRRYEIEDGDKRYTINEAQHYSTRSGGAVVPAGNKIQQFEPNSVVGHVGSVDAGRDILRRLVAGDRTALAELGYDTFPTNLDTNKVEWGLARRWDGKLAVVLGGFADINWAVLPHMKPLSHTHPFMTIGALKGKNGDGLVRIDELGDLSDDMRHLFPSAADVALMAAGKIRNHVVHTPFVARSDGRIANPGPGETGATVDFVIEKSTYVGRWAGAEDVGVYRATITARTPDGTIWRGEIYAVDAGASMLYRSRPPISSVRLPPPRPRFETKNAMMNPVLVAKLKKAGVPDPAVNTDVAMVLGAMDAGTEKWMDELLDLAATGRVTGIKEWWDGLLANPSGDRVGNMLVEVREARRVVDERPGEVIELGNDARAPTKPGKPTEIDAAFDFEASAGGSVTGSIEIKAAGLLHKAADLESTLDSSIAKIKQRKNHGQPIPGPHEVRFDVSFPGKGRVPASGNKTIQHDGNGVRTIFDPRGTQIPAKPDKPNPIDIRDEVTAYLNDKTTAQALDSVVLTDGNGVIARYKNNGGTWVKL